MKGICPNCEKDTELKLVRTEEAFKIRGETIKVETEYFKCLECEEEFQDPRSDHDPLESAYREFRRRRGMIQPEEIRDFRKRYGLTQKEISDLMGWGGATLSRYENGALQDDTHEKTLRLVMEPRNLLKLIETSPEALPEKKRVRLIAELKAEEEEACALERIYEERFGNYEADELSGYKKLDLAKLFNAILFFCKEGVVKTKLNKLLFYADFRHFRDYAISITGARYAHVPFGPAPDKYDYYFASLKDNGQLAVEEVNFSEEISGEVFTAIKKPDLSLFSDSELKILASVDEHFKAFSARKITDFSHEEKGYKETPAGRIISYQYAEDLQI